MCLFAAQVLAGWLTAALLCRVRGIPEPLPAPPAAAQAPPPPALDAILAQAAVTYLKLCGFVLYFRLLAAGCGDNKLKHKVGAALCTLRRSGGMETYQQLLGTINMQLIGNQC